MTSPEKIAAIAQIAQEIGAEYAANKGYITMGDARKDLAALLGVDRWVSLSSQQRDWLTDEFNKGVAREKIYQLPR